MSLKHVQVGKAVAVKHHQMRSKESAESAVLQLSNRLCARRWRNDANTQAHLGAHRAPITQTSNSIYARKVRTEDAQKANCSNHPLEIHFISNIMR